MNISKVSFTGIYNIHCSSKEQADILEKNLRGYTMRKRGKNNIYYITPEEKSDISAMANALQEAENTLTGQEHFNHDVFSATRKKEARLCNSLRSSAIDIYV